MMGGHLELPPVPIILLLGMFSAQIVLTMSAYMRYRRRAR